MRTTTQMHTAARRRLDRRMTALSAVATLALTWTSAAHATPFVEARAITNPNTSCNFTDCHPVDDIEKAIAGPQHATAFSIGGFSQSGTATADVGYGAMHLYSQWNGGGNAQAFGWIHDDVMFTAANVPKGANVEVTFSVFVEGQLTGAGPLKNGAAGSWLLQSGIGGGYLPMVEQGADYATTGYIGDPFGLFTVTEAVQSGFFVPFDIELRATAAASTGDSAIADLSHTLLWGGVSQVTYGGKAVDFSVTSASGTNWANSFIPAATTGAPEPATWAMMLVGFGGLGSLMRRRRRNAAVAA